ncbi:unnamed protein product [Protopolystoma xenopodis]|uniref:Uncharacterized protein n=1 Tax=Protopolystoma xenopodis TaxID=117903 RepID=A0A3S5FD77_9PLAT|nr:unnamed protein product [Protopolystoma xenopodis]
MNVPVEPIDSWSSEIRHRLSSGGTDLQISSRNTFTRNGTGRECSFDPKRDSNHASATSSRNTLTARRHCNQCYWFTGQLSRKHCYKRTNKKWTMLTATCGIIFISSSSVCVHLCMCVYDEEVLDPSEFVSEPSLLLNG